MLIPEAQLKLTNIPFGQTARVKSQQYGDVQLQSDGAVDADFKARDGYGSTAGWTDFKDPALAKFVAAETQLAAASLKQARADFESGTEIKKYEVSDLNGKQVSAAIKEAGLTGSVFAQSDWRGVITGTSVHLGKVGEGGQSLKISHQGEKSEAVLESWRGQGRHTITVPVLPDGSLDLPKSQESLTLDTPWLLPNSTNYAPESGVRKIDDPRLERLAAAAQQGFLLPPSELGAGWKCETGENRQTWKNSSQSVVLDPQERSFSINSHGSYSARGGEVDVDVDSAVKWQNGQMQIVK
jgi:hypothetical protein